MGTQKKQFHISQGKSPFSGISLWLDAYDDIFSDFDPRTHEERNISDDFLYELKKVAGEREQPVEELRLLLPASARNKNLETIITKRLQRFFTESHQLAQERLRINRLKNVAYVFSGSLCMLAASMIAPLRNGLFMNVLFVVLEPTGWFLSWSGMDGLIGGLRERKKEPAFYRKMTDTKIVFYDIPENKI